MRDQEAGMSNIDINQLLSQMRAMAAAAQGSTAVQAPEEPDKPGFADLLKQSVQQVNDNKLSAGDLSEAFVRQDPDVDLAEVMVALQKASLSFQAMTEVRNKLVQAYQEIMNLRM
jgi:flagellar hook-basal body complex protein FliE